MADLLVRRRPQTVLEIVAHWCRIAHPFHQCSPLEMAVRCGNVEDVATLVEHGRDCARSEEGKNIFVVKCACARQLSGENGDWENLAAMAAERNDAEMERYLVSVSQVGSVGGGSRRSQVFPTLVFRRAETVEEIVVRWCRIARRLGFYEPLLAAVRYGELEDVATFLERGRDCALRLGEEDPRLCGYGPRLVESDDWSAESMSLENAIFGGNTELVRYLISRGADFNAEFALRNAVYPCQNAEIVRLLLNADADVNHACILNRDPLWPDNGTEILRILLDHQVDVNFRDESGNIALFYAKSNPQQMQLLIDRGAVFF